MDPFTKEALERLIDQAPGHIHLWRFVSGAAFALQQYDLLRARYPNDQNSEEYYRKETLELLAECYKGTDPPGNWRRGFFYNAAIMRLDAAWERSIRTILNEDSKHIKGPELYNRLYGTAPNHPEYDQSTFGRVRETVNMLKHRQHGAGDLTEEPDILRESLHDLLRLLNSRLAGCSSFSLLE